MGGSRVRSLILSLPAVASILLWLSICGGRPTFLGVGPARLLPLLAAASVLSFGVAIGHLAWSRTSAGVVACFALNLVAFLANILGYLALFLAVR